LHAARVVGASLLGILGVRIVADLYPGSFLGGPEQLVSLANVYALASALVSALVCTGLLAGRRWAFVAATLLLSANVGVFVPVIAFDVQIGGFLSLWNLGLIGDSLFALTSGATRARRLGDHGELFAWLRRYGPAAQHLLLVSLLAGLALFGFEIEHERVPTLIALAFALATLAFVSPYALALMRERRRSLPAFAAALLLAAAMLPATLGSALVVLWALQAALLLVLVIRGPVFADLLTSFFARPALLIVATFALLAFAGALALTFPAAAADGRSIAFIDALFTAMSATCVTGLVVLDTPFDLSTFGHIVILGLIQLGGLGIMVLSTFAAVLLAGRLPLSS
jgi:trk system potassium uptake protein TrkH